MLLPAPKFVSILYSVLEFVVLVFVLAFLLMIGFGVALSLGVH